jgi:predicted HAD superfamily Cof-like phosphohydrolase
MLTNFEKVKEFHQRFNVPIRETPSFPSVEIMSDRSRKIEEELDEFREEMAKIIFEGIPEDEEEQRKLLAFIIGEAIDVIYTFYGLGVSCGVNMDDVFAAIHRANMTKTLEGDKIKKGAKFTPANIQRVIFDKIVQSKSPWAKEVV